ncbi:hypothetical protein SG34_007490 [Thalassomonas viridans]|uniref:Uncharacterized protein n=1 Tax=Thalassomonas viridans TaxID=137584 RepID=A0AAE9Z512_9GAMM|nr:hypothetical protein [Thalassomonas viridans]WDE06738.1 hypothetical protein SG34_007490 [Thalassomonas viridans]
MDWLKSKFSTTAPSHSYKPFESHSSSSGSGQFTSEQGSYVKVEGPSVNRGVGGDYTGVSGSLGGVKVGVPMNETTTFGGGVGLKSLGGGVGQSEDHLGGQTTTVDVPFTPFSLFKTSYSPGTSPWGRKSAMEDQAHTEKLRREGIQMEMEDIKKKRNMLSTSDFNRQMSYFQSKLDSNKGGQ